VAVAECARDSAEPAGPRPAGSVCDPGGWRRLTLEPAPGDAPSQFWAELGEAHRRDLEVYGLDQVKRHQALRYFTWGWRWGQLARSEQFRFLVRHTPPATLLRAARARTDLSDEGWRGVPWSRSDRWLYAFATRLIWEFARRCEGTAPVLRLPEPELGSPLPVQWEGRLISQDLANTALEVAAIVRALGGRVPASIVEVGVGYGRTAHALLALFPEVAYTVVDIEPALGIAEWYLTSLYPGRSLQFLSPAQAEALDARFDLAISISSLQEMTLEQVRSYLELFHRTTPGGRVYLKQWKSWRNPQDGITLTFDEYPIPSGWRLLFTQPAAIQTRFVEAAWRVPVPTEGRP
jgi:putative sugar O-methyltransferase